MRRAGDLRFRVAAAYGVCPRSPSLALQRESIEPISQIFTMGYEFILVVFEEIGLCSFPLRKTGMGVSLCHRRDPVGWLVPYDTWARDLCYVVTCLMLRGLVPYDTK